MTDPQATRNISMGVNTAYSEHVDALGLHAWVTKACTSIPVAQPT